MQIVGLENQATDEKSFGGVIRLISSSWSATRPSFADQLIRRVYARRRTHVYAWRRRAEQIWHWLSHDSTGRSEYV